MTGLRLISWNVNGFRAVVKKGFWDFLDKEKPLLSVAKKPDELHVSARGNQYLVDKGLGLGSALQQAAKVFQGHGGGHRIAAGATVSSSIEKDFIKEIDAIISTQLHLKRE